MNGVVHDLGYRRYVGSRRPQSSRWQVILRNQVATAWSTWWRLKAWLTAAAIILAAVCVIMYFWRTTLAPLFDGKVQLTWMDAVLPASLKWFRQVGFLVSLTVGATAIASDSISGAFTFYFSRPVRPIDYLAGKLGGLIVVQLLVQGIPPLLAGMFRVGLSVAGSDAVEILPVVPQMLGLSLLSAVVYAAVPLGISALVPHRRNAILIWVAYYWMIGTLAVGIGIASGTPVAALDIPVALASVTQAVMGIEVPAFFGGRGVIPPVGWAIASLVLQVGAALAIAYHRVRAAQQAGIGSSS